MFRYFGIALSSSDQTKSTRVGQLVQALSRRDSRWAVILDQPTLTILHIQTSQDGLRAYSLGPSGAILGQLFTRPTQSSSAAADVILNDSQIDRIVKTEGSVLGSEFWGSYVAIMATHPDRHCVVRDPTGAIQCYLTTVDGITFVFSHVEDFLNLRLTALSINWPHVVRYLTFPRIIEDATGFAEITQLHAGQSARIRGGRWSTRFNWSPSHVYSSKVLDDTSVASETLRDAVRLSVSSWAARYRSSLLELSGGLDSAIVLSCFPKALSETSLVCANLYTSTPEGDERAFARKAASLADRELIEIPLGVPDGHLHEMLNAEKVASPTMVSMSSPADSALEQIVSERGIDAVFSGQGGDHLFQRRRNNLIAAEHLQLHGLSTRLIRVVRDTSRLTRNPISLVFRDAVIYGLFKRPFDIYADFQGPAFLRREVAQSNLPEQLVHPWIAEARALGLPQSKVVQIADIVDCQAFYSQVCRYTDIVHPLISQPVFEASLAIPTYVLTVGGTERALVRNAFANDIPPEIATRTTKGGATGHFHNMILDNLKFVREYLLDGLLLNKGGIFDRQELDGTLSEARLLHPLHLTSVLASILAESWVRAIYQSP